MHVPSQSTLSGARITRISANVRRRPDRHRIAPRPADHEYRSSTNRRPATPMAVRRSGSTINASTASAISVASCRQSPTRPPERSPGLLPMTGHHGQATRRRLQIDDAQALELEPPPSGPRRHGERRHLSIQLRKALPWHPHLETAPEHRDAPPGRRSRVSNRPRPTMSPETSWPRLRNSAIASITCACPFRGTKRLTQPSTKSSGTRAAGA